MYEYDKGPDPDDFLGSVQIPKTGYVFMNYTQAEIFDIDPYLCVYHKCGVPPGEDCNIVTTIPFERTGDSGDHYGDFFLDYIDLATYESHDGVVGKEECVMWPFPKKRC